MAGIPSIGTVGSRLEIQNEFQARVAKLQKEAIDMQGEMAIQLIESATAQQAAGRQLDITI